MMRGARWVETHLRVQPVRWVGAGLLLAVGTGLGSLLSGHPFLTSHFQYADLPLFGRIPLASAVLFDLGVFCLVVGATTLMLIALAHQSLLRPRGAPIVTAEGTIAPEGAGCWRCCCRSPSVTWPRPACCCCSVRAPSRLSSGFPCSPPLF